ncbi:MAG: protein arginine kinase [Clostridia bacterium]|nr:protein arginine kinase [Clostridia bacterium]MBQ4396369.1 protein arginine kinase [Clostridia bacterium]
MSGNEKNTERKWYQTQGKEADTVISTRLRFARNLNGYPFPHRMTDAQKKEVNEKVRDALIGGNSALRDSFTYVEADQLSPVQLAAMVERHLISPEFAGNPKGRALLMMKDESVSIMLNEEDHLRIQVMGSGLQLDELYDTADKIDTLLDETLHFAFDEELGYLTACPTNLGTGMRASVMLHLPALTASGTLNRIASSLDKMGATIRGSYGEGSQSSSAMYQVSNQVTLGISEKDTLSNLTEITRQMIALEKKARAGMLKSEAYQDTVWRALGLMKCARVMSSEEFGELYSALRMGVAEGIVTDVTLDRLADLYVKVQPANIMEQYGKELTPSQRDQKRAEILRNELR